MAIDDEVLDWLSDAAMDADSWHSVDVALRTHDLNGEDLRLRPFTFAFGYILQEGSSSNRSAEPFAPSLAGEGWQFPPALADIEEDDVEAWRDAFNRLVDLPVARSRLGDLLWERKVQPRPDLAAKAACDALLDVAENPAWHVMNRVGCLSRALELTLETRDDVRRRKVVARLTALAEADLQSGGEGPGVPLRALLPLVGLPAHERPMRLDDLLQRVCDRYGEDPFIFDSIADLRSPLLTIEQHDQLRREQVRRWREHAAEAEMMLRVHRLERALELARAHGLRQEADDLRRELGAIRPEDLKLERISSHLEIESQEIEKYLDVFSQAATWRMALHSLAAQSPPGGSPDVLADRVDKQMAEFPIQYLFTKVIIGPDNATAIFRAAEPDAHRRLASAESRAFSARFWSPFCVEILDRIRDRSDRPDHAELTKFFTTDFIEPEVAERLARGLELFWDGQPDESAHVLVPRLERVLREMARQVGIPVVREPRPGREVGGVEMLGVLLRALERAFPDPGWHAYLVNLLADPLGLNLRNVIAHGLHGAVGRLDAALLVQAALLLAVMSPRPADSPATPPPGAARR